MKDETRIASILTILDATYPTAHIMLDFHSPWELLVAVMLSAQCTDKLVNTVTPKLFATYPTIHDYASASIADIEKLVKQTGFYRNKAQHIADAAKRIINVYGGEVPKNMADLLTLPGVARKTANVVLANAFNINEGIAVDTHVIRLSQRLRLVPIHDIGGKIYTYVEDDKKTIDFIKDARPEKIEQHLMKMVAKNDWKTVTYKLIDHGRAVCKAVHPLCATCVLATLCPAKRTI